MLNFFDDTDVMYEIWISSICKCNRAFRWYCENAHDTSNSLKTTKVNGSVALHYHRNIRSILPQSYHITLHRNYSKKLEATDTLNW
jgi:hypothetical protein